MDFKKSSLGIFLLLTIFIIQGCESDVEYRDEKPLVIRIASEPDNLHPFYSRSTYATQIESLIFLPLAEFDLKAEKLLPLLVEKLHEPETIAEGEYAGGLRFNYTIREEARWADGEPVTAEDYLFTVKSIINSYNQANVLRSYLSFIKDIQIDLDNPRKFSVIVPDPYILAEYVVCNFNILPAHRYDSTGVYDDISLEQLLQPESFPLPAGKDSLLRVYAEGFTKLENYRDGLIGSGGYILDEWVTGEYIKLKRVDDWWADKLDNRPELLYAYPPFIEYRIIPDETTALAALREGSVDLVSEVSSDDFIEMRDDPSLQERFGFHTPPLMQYNCLELNTKMPGLDEKAVRHALAHSIDYASFIDNVAFGLAERTVGPFHTTKSFYNKELQPIEYNIGKAKELLAGAGWNDSDGDGTVDKMIDGKVEELLLDVIVSQKEEGQQVALIIKQNAANAGIGINIVTIDGTKLLAERRARNFEVLPLRKRTEPGLEDPYGYWHSTSDSPGGGNVVGFRNARADSLLEQIRVTLDEEKRNVLYEDFQEILYEEQAIIYLYIPLEKIIVNSQYSFVTSPRRPGYFENLMKLKPR